MMTDALQVSTDNLRTILQDLGDKEISFELVIGVGLNTTTLEHGLASVTSAIQPIILHVPLRKHTIDNILMGKSKSLNKQLIQLLRTLFSILSTELKGSHIENNILTVPSVNGG